jgi:DNA-binding response OmpR family regulator
VLVVDDNRDAAETLALLVRAMGHDARHTYEARGALALAREFQPDVALLDIAMPRVNGYELVRELRALDVGKPMLIAAVTGLGHHASREQALGAGFDRFMVKPIGIDNLVELFAERA